MADSCAPKIFTPTNIHIETADHSLRHAAHTCVVVLLGLSDERHVGIIQIQGIDQRQGLIVQHIDVARESAARLPDSGRTGSASASGAGSQ